MPQELDAFQAKTVAKQQAAGDATGDAWKNLWRDKVHANKNME